MTTDVDGVFYGRNYKLTFIPLDSSQTSIELEQKGQTTAQKFNPGLAIEFVVENTFPYFGTGSTNKANIRIYNLSEKTARAIQVSGLFIFQVGYDSLSPDRQLVTIFEGILSQSSAGRDGANTYLDLSLVQGDIVAKNNFFIKSYEKNTPLTKVILDIQKFIRKDYRSDSGVKQISFTKKVNDKVYKTARTFSGRPMQLLASLLPDHYIYTVDNLLTILPRTVGQDSSNIISGPSILFNPDYGQIGFTKTTGQASTESNAKNFTNIECQSVLNADIKIGSIIRVKPSELQRKIFVSAEDFANKEDGFYRCTSVTHAGNTFNGDFTTTWTGELINTKTTKGA